MKNSNKKQLIKPTLIILLLALLSGCTDFLVNPLKDKETGENINLLILDFNFFNTRMTYKLFDAKDSSIISLPAEVRFSGKNGDDIVTFSGEKQPVHTTTQGQLELTIDPNVTISESSLFEFAINVEIDGYNQLLKGFQLSNEGKKTFELFLVNTSDEDNTNLDGDINVEDGDTSIIFIAPPVLDLKSAQVEEKTYEIHYSILLSDFVYLKDTYGNFIFETYGDVVDSLNSNPGNFASFKMSTYSEYAPGIDVVNDGGLKSLLFHKLETGQLDSFVVLGIVVGDLTDAVINSWCEYTGDIVPDIFGFAEFDIQLGAWNFLGTQRVYENLDIEYTVAKASTETLCETGSSITFSSSAISSFSIDADVFDEDGNQINSINFKGNFTETFIAEYTPSKKVKLDFRDNNPSFAPISDLEIDNFCEGSYNVVVEPNAGYDEYQIVLKAICPDNPTVAIAPTYSAEIKIKGSTDPWQGVDMIGGKVDLMGVPNQEYDLRLLWEDEWEYSAFSTFFDLNDGSYTGAAYSKTVITSEYIEDGRRIRINVEKEFEQNICDDLGW